MKPFISFEAKDSDYAYEGARLRKNLKGALEMVDVGWVSSLFASPDLVHLLSPLDEVKGKEAVSEGLPLVVSAFYGEDDPFTRFLENDSKGVPALRKNAERLLSLANLIFVPYSEAKTFLRQAGINCRIEVLTPGVNLSRFEDIDSIEATLFPRYVGIPSGTQYAILKGDYEDNGVIEDVKTLASSCPNIRLFYIGMGKRGPIGRLARQHLTKTSPSNVRYLDVLDDDVYRSAMLGAKAYICFPFSHPDSLTPLEAMASHVQVFSLGPALLGDSVTDLKTGFAFSSVDELAKSLQSYCAGEGNSTIIGGYKEAKSRSLLKMGEELKAYYEQLLKEGEKL